MQQQSERGRYINSVSDLLYSPDEIEFLLDDIRALETATCKPEELQETDGMTECDVLPDFEIAGSRTGGLSVTTTTNTAGGGGGSGGGGGDSSAIALACDCESPLGTANSWDSHSHYRGRDTSPALSLYSGVIVHCDHSHLKTPTGVLRLLLLITSTVCLICLCTSGTVQVGLFMLPFTIRLRFMMFVALVCIFATSVLLFLDVSQILTIFPFNWYKVNGYFFLALSVLFVGASSLIIYTVFGEVSFAWVPRWTDRQLIISSSLGYLCAFQSALLAFIQGCAHYGATHYKPVAEDPSLTLTDHAHSKATDCDERTAAVQEYRIKQTTQIYKPLINYTQLATSTPPATAHHQHAVAAAQQQLNRTSKTNAQNNSIRKVPHKPSRTICMDDVQPCSSKSLDPQPISQPTK